MVILNPDKCITMKLGKSMNAPCFRIGRDEISLAEDIKRLGVTLDNDLNFDKHMADIARKVGNQILVLQRHKKLIDTGAKIRLYIMLILK